MKGKVTFVGAGPGDVELITLKGYKALKEADMVIYAGSLINTDLLDYCKEGCKLHNSATLDLKEILELMKRGTDLNYSVVRLHTGDFSLYGSIREQIEELKKLNIEFEAIPGVSSFLGAASSVGTEYTVPEVSQSLIITRMAGRTPVPEKESLRLLAQHQTSMVIFLSIQGIDAVVSELKEGGYSDETPVVVIYKATWPEEKIVKGTLADIAEKVRAANITKTALIMVGDFLGETYYYSKLYDSEFKHEYRP
ncbi:cobalt-precorrin-4 methyltransferase [Facklamia sp. DSM 111018]|uniref:Cobalt-precorrin-4 methyltransferase n=1 Tax=Facklamia lactis TaxID=2749967 RepID=A0ABS0LR38_9LACT|nr:cobalt-precorrin-4 methyltransferase [Facklamia lactis]MBG9979499.1 cobalt-precorrin-4 methyltransferase [Facklamia lactis]MBG9985831.1 cobalt-precorrin-4 methyltransferase [Facklamia lactis]